jgi:fluoroquinolone resistance protein
MRAMIQSQTQYTDQTLEDLQYERAAINASEFHGCIFRRCSFVESVFHRCRFVECTFIQSDLSLVQVPGSVFSAVCFEASRVIGVNWAQADWSGTQLGEPLGFHESAIRHATFIGLDLKRIQIKDCVATEADFREADLSGADFSGTDLSGSLFLNTTLRGADLSSARNYTIAPRQNDLRGAKFSLPEAMSLLHNLDIKLVDR